MPIFRVKLTWVYKAYDRVFKWYHSKRQNDFVSPTVRRTGEFKYIDRDELKIPLIRFSQPLRDEFGRQLNANNIMFCVGPRKSGKTWLIKSAAAEMTENKPIIFDFQQYYTLQCLEKQLVDLIKQDQNQTLLPNEEQYLPSRIIQLIQCLQNRNICLLFLNFDSLFERYPYDKKLYDFLDKLLLTYVNLSGIRNKIPIILESENSQFFNRDLFEFLHLDQYEFTTSDVNHLEEIYGQFKDHNHEVEYNKFKNKLYSVYGRPECAQLLDDQSIDQSIIESLLIIKKNQGKMFTGRHFADVRLLEHPVFISLQNVGILHHPRYVSCLQLAQPFYLGFVERWLKEKGVTKLDEFIRYRDEGVLTNYFRMNAKRINIKDYQNEPREKLFNDDETGERPYHFTWSQKTGSSVK